MDERQGLGSGSFLCRELTKVTIRVVQLMEAGELFLANVISSALREVRFGLRLS
jgi:hypothetical protein